MTPETLSPGQQAIGYTVRERDLVESFTVEILGVNRGALGSGMDLIVVNTSGPAIGEGGRRDIGGHVGLARLHRAGSEMQAGERA